MNLATPHIIVAPIVLPLVSAAVLLLLGDTRRRWRPVVNLAATVAGLVVATTILLRVDHADGDIAVYLAANWEAPFGIVLVADRLAALMLVLVGIVSLCAALYAEAAWARAGVYFYPLFQIQLMGLNGAFLTGDLFNLFVFFEVMLAASYGLHLHGSGLPRVRTGLHYIAVNLLASALFLVGLAVLYGVLGTLNMADIADKLKLVPASDRGLLHAGATILALAFLIKAALWPLNAWLVPAYTAASTPVVAVFAIMTKVGVYAVLRLWTLFFSADTAPSVHFGQPVLVYGGLATLAFGTIGIAATLRIGRLAAYSLIVSSGTLLAAIGVGTASATAAALYYLLSGTLAASALFLLGELIERIGADGRTRLPHVEILPDEDVNLDDDALPLIGRTVPVSVALLGLAFMACALLIAGLPPLSGFLAKFSLLGAVLDPDGAGSIWHVDWIFLALLLLSGLSATVSLARTGIWHFWANGQRSAPRVKTVEAIAVVALLGACIALTVWAEPVMRYTNATAAQLHEPRGYIERVLSTKAQPRPGQPAPDTEASP